MLPDKKQLSQLIKQQALNLGFSNIGFAEAGFLSTQAATYEQWLKNGNQAGMQYMERNIDKRLNPKLLVDNAKTVISVLYNYYTPKKLSNPDAPQFSIYANGTDYHYVIKDMLTRLTNFILSIAGPVNARSFVDSAPVMDKIWAQKAGLGWIGKNSCLITPTGSFYFIGEIICDLELAYNNVEMKDYCGNCTRCIQACPTGAINTNRTINSGKCISYLTIEERNEIPVELKQKFENWVFGCDICQNVCPHNSRAIIHNEQAFEPNPELFSKSLTDWLQLSKPEFKRLFKNSAVQRTGYKGLMRNITFINNVSSN